jgi:hypothetical protein
MFTWEKTVSEVLKVYNEILSETTNDKNQVIIKELLFGTLFKPEGISLRDLAEVSALQILHFYLVC